MSAFMVSDAHINALVQFIVDKRVYLKNWDVSPDAQPFLQARPHDAQAIGDALIRANRESLVSRYGEAERLGFEMEEDWVYKISLHPFTPVEIIKATQCFDYQACEVDDYRSTWAADTMERIRATATRELPGYEAAAWEIKVGYDRDSNIVSLSELAAGRA